MSIHKPEIVETILATEDLSGAQFKIVTTAGAVAANANAVAGILLNKPESGEHASVAMTGRLKGYAAGTIAAGARLTVTTSGYITTVVSGSGTAIGKNTNTAAASGDIFSFFADFVSAHSTVGQQ